jgi:hypothetical protein
VVAAAAELRDQVIGLVLEEYEAYAPGKSLSKLLELEVRGGVIELCGAADDDTAPATVCYVRASDGAVRPLAVGPKQRVIAEFDQIDKRGPLVDEVLPPVAWVDGAAHYFTVARGQRLIGVVESGDVVVLLAAAGDRLIAVVRTGRGTTTLPLGRPGSVREVDVDLMLRFLGPHAAPTASRMRRPSSSTQAHHLRIVAGDRVDLRGGPAVAEVLRAAFEDIAVRATTRPVSAASDADAVAGHGTRKRKKLRGKTLVRLVLEYLRKLALRGLHDLEGLVGQILRAIQREFPEFRITSTALADALKLIAATRTCLIAPRARGSRTWHINLHGLNDPTSARHRQLCRETRTVRIVEQNACRSERQADGEEPRRSAQGEERSPSSPSRTALCASESEPREFPKAGEPQPAPETSSSPQPDADAEESTAPPCGQERGVDAWSRSDVAVTWLVYQLQHLALVTSELLLWTFQLASSAPATSTGVRPAGAASSERTEMTTPTPAGPPTPTTADAVAADEVAAGEGADTGVEAVDGRAVTRGLGVVLGVDQVGELVHAEGDDVDQAVGGGVDQVGELVHAEGDDQAVGGGVDQVGEFVHAEGDEGGGDVDEQAVLGRGMAGLGTDGEGVGPEATEGDASDAGVVGAEGEGELATMRAGPSGREGEGQAADDVDAAVSPRREHERTLDPLSATSTAPTPAMMKRSAPAEMAAMTMPAPAEIAATTIAPVPVAVMSALSAEVATTAASSPAKTEIFVRTEMTAPTAALPPAMAAVIEAMRPAPVVGVCHAPPHAALRAPAARTPELPAVSLRTLGSLGPRGPPAKAALQPASRERRRRGRTASPRGR